MKKEDPNQKLSYLANSLADHFRRGNREIVKAYLEMLFQEAISGLDEKNMFALWSWALNKPVAPSDRKLRDKEALHSARRAGVIVQSLSGGVAN